MDSSRNTKQANVVIEAGRAGITDRIECMPHALTVRELKALLQVSDQTIYRMIADHTIPLPDGPKLLQIRPWERVQTSALPNHNHAALVEDLPKIAGVERP